MSKRVMLFCLAILVSGLVYAAEDKRVDITGFETPDEAGIVISGGSIVNTGVFDPSGDNVPKHQGDYALFGEYDTSLGNWTFTNIVFPTPVDLTGMREFHFWIYFFPDAQPDHNGNYPLRIIAPNGSCLYESPLKGAPGAWQEVVVPIDRWSSDNELSNFSQISIIWLPGATNNATGKFYVDDFFATRKAATPAVKDVLVYGFNKKNAGNNYPEGWQIRSADALDENSLKMGDAAVEPSEGADYLECVLPGGWKRPFETINSLKDFDQWNRVIDITVDARMSEDFTPWFALFLVIESSAGGYQQLQYRDTASSKTSWKTVCWDVDMTQYASVFNDPNGWLRLSFIAQAGEPATGSLYLDNLRVGIPTTYVAGVRSFSNNTFTGGESFDVQLALTADGDAQDYEIVETVPAGWTASAISDGGTVANGKITWNKNFTGAKNLTYKVTAPAKPSTDGSFAGTVGGLKVQGAAKISYIYPKLMELVVEAKFLNNTVTLDGLIGTAEYAGANSYTFGHDNTIGNSAPGVHISGTSYPDTKEFVKFYVQHDAKFIYVACDVTDPNLTFAETANAWESDSVEVYLDGNLSRSTPKDANAYGPQMTVVGDGSMVGGQGVPAIVKGTGFNSSTDGAYWNFGARAKADGSGYVVEYKLDKSKMLLPLDRALVGFDILMNSSEKGAGARTGKWGWYSSKQDGSVFEDYDDESGWGLMKLLPGSTAVSDWSVF